VWSLGKVGVVWAWFGRGSNITLRNITLRDNSPVGNSPFSHTLTETWLNDTNNDNFNIEKYDFISSNRSNKRGEGVGIYIIKETEYKIRKDLNSVNEDGIESVFIEINMPFSKNIIVGTFNI
jgi:hypothetical protein